MNAYDVIKKPVTSEKSYSGINIKKYCFIVDAAATKTDIKKAVEEIFKVKVASVNTVNLKGKLKRQGRTQGYTPDRKKAYVSLTADSKPIEFFESLG